jgi:hypothetical protein
MPPTYGITPEVSRLHWNDLLSQFQLHISWQLTTPFGTFPHKEEVLTFGDLATALNAIKTIWAIVATATDDDQKAVFAPLGDFTMLTSVSEGTVLRTAVAVELPPPSLLILDGPDVVPDYDGESDSWGATAPS